MPEDRADPGISPAAFGTASRSIRKIYHGPDWKTNITFDNLQIFSDLKGGTLPSVSWVIPSLYDSDHPASGCNGGPWWVTKVVDAIGASRDWKNTADHRSLGRLGRLV